MNQVHALDELPVLTTASTYRAALAGSAKKYHKISLSQLKNLGSFNCIAKITNIKNPLGQSKNPLSYWKDNTFHKVTTTCLNWSPQCHAWGSVLFVT